MSFHNKAVLVTGSSSGIGAAVAVQFAAERAYIAIVGRNKIKLANVSAECEEKGSKPLVIEADLTKDEDVKRTVETTVQHYGRLDILVNSAGIIGPTNILDDSCMRTFDKVIRINLRATVHVTNIAAPYLIHTKGNIINICGVSAVSILRNSGAFADCASKAAVEHFTRCIAAELAPKGVRVNAVNPGAVKTDLIANMGVRHEAFMKSIWARLQNLTALDRMSDPSEIANIVLFLASDKAQSITGASILSDNGTVLKGIDWL